LEFGRLIFYPVPLADWRDLVDLSLFDGFHPGMTFRAAEGEFGSPDRKGDDYLGPYWDYERPLGTVRISHKLKGSLPFLRWWRLEGFPEASDLEHLLHPNVVKHIPEDLERLTVVIMNNEGAPGGFVQVRKNKITSIDWVNNEGSGGTRDAS